MSDTQTEYNVTTEEITVAPLTPEELAQRELDIATSVQLQADQDKADEEHQAALALVNAKLEKIGLTPADLATLGKEFKTL